jgi:hypothetical protein
VLGSLGLPFPRPAESGLSKREPGASMLGNGLVRTLSSSRTTNATAESPKEPGSHI